MAVCALFHDLKDIFYFSAPEIIKIKLKTMLAWSKKESREIKVLSLQFHRFDIEMCHSLQHDVSQYDFSDLSCIEIPNLFN